MVQKINKGNHDQVPLPWKPPSYSPRNGGGYIERQQKLKHFSQSSLLTYLFLMVPEINNINHDQVPSHSGSPPPTPPVMGESTSSRSNH